jgi:Na+(H+)/acetate symporter ActP
MKPLPTVLISHITETKIILLAVPLVAIAYWVCTLRGKKPFNLQDLIVLVFDVVAGITGIVIFVGAWMDDTSSEHAVWSGIGGVCIALFFLEQVRVVFKGLLFCEPEPTEKDQA